MTIICVGMAVVDILVQGFAGTPTLGTTAFVDRVGMGVGGDALNQASALAKLGHRCQLVTSVGDDPDDGEPDSLHLAGGVGVRSGDRSGDEVDLDIGDLVVQVGAVWHGVAPGGVQRE